MPRGNLTYRRGEIRWVRLDPTLGAEIQKPALASSFKMTR